MKIKWADTRTVPGSQLQAGDIVTEGQDSETVDCVLVERVPSVGCGEMHFDVRNANDNFQGKRTACFDRAAIQRIVRP